MSIFILVIIGANEYGYLPRFNQDINKITFPIFQNSTAAKILPDFSIVVSLWIFKQIYVF